MSAALEAGARPWEACAAGAEICREVADLSAALRAASADARAGHSAAAALARVPDLGPVAHAWRVGSETGTPIADLLARVAADLQAALHVSRALHAQLAGPRASAALLAVLPIMGVLLGAGLGADPARILLRTSAGHVLLGVGVAMDAVGVAVTAAIVARAQPP
jgi:tight adherence protein B